MRKIKNYEKTSSAFPSQWNATLETGEDVYIRYRNGFFISM